MQLRQDMAGDGMGGRRRSQDVNEAIYMEIRAAASAAFAEFMQQVREQDRGGREREGKRSTAIRA